MLPSDPYGVDDLLVAIGVMVACLSLAYLFLELGSWISRK